MSEDRTDSQQAEPIARLIAATLACIEEHGISALTTRLIASQAGMNPAAVNYYFRSKDRLVEQVLALTLREGFVEPLVDFDRLVEQGVARAEALRRVVHQMVSDSLAYPKITFAHLRGAIENQRYDGPAVVESKEFLDQLERRLGPLPTPEQHLSRRIGLAQVWGVIGLHAMAPGLFLDFTKTGLSRDEYLDQFVHQLLAGLQIP
jgi:AcrR family transcriptional regulator